jgi:hypothetical protein
LESALTGLRKSLDDLWQLPEADVVDLIRRNHRVVAQLQFLGLDLLTEAQQRSIPARQASASAANWLSGLLRLSPGAAKEQVRVAESLAHRKRLDDVIDPDVFLPRHRRAHGEAQSRARPAGRTPTRNQRREGRAHPGPAAR